MFYDGFDATGTKGYQRLKTVQLGPSNLRTWIEGSRQEIPEDVLRNVLGSSMLQGAKRFFCHYLTTAISVLQITANRPAEPLEPDTESTEESIEITNPVGPTCCLNGCERLLHLLYNPKR